MDDRDQGISEPLASDAFCTSVDNNPPIKYRPYDRCRWYQWQRSIHIEMNELR